MLQLKMVCSLGLGAWFLTFTTAGITESTAVQFVATAPTIKRVYHSPQTPGYTCWTGCWLMPDGRLMTSFHQATGPLERRPHTRQDILDKLSWPPQGKPEYVKYDMAGLCMSALHLASNDGGKTWRRMSIEHVSTPMNGWTCQAESVTAEGVIFRAVFGLYLPFYDVPQTAYWQRSTDGSRTWSSPQAFFDETRWLARAKRLRVLRNGRLLVSGAVWKPGPHTRHEWSTHSQPALWFSDDQGQSWSDPLMIWNEDNIRPSEELDFAELPNGDLLVVIRVDETRCRWQTLLRKHHDTWQPEPVRRLWIPHSGMPDLLATREGPVLHLATDGIAFTNDGGQNWKYLKNQGEIIRTGYYPSSVQLPDGRIFSIYHVGGDNYYGQVDQSIESITFKIKKTE